MDTGRQPEHAETDSGAPPVVGVMVVHDVGAWFDEVVYALSEQDYPALRWVMLLDTADDAMAADVAARIADRLPEAIVRRSPPGRGFGPTANEILDLVEGDNGFFLLCHDDVAPGRDAVRQMVAELYRSNSGIVGPKYVEWDDPRRLHDLGFRMDRYGELIPTVELGEIDQGQHDGRLEVFAVSSAFVLVRADLFRALGGFDPAMPLHGEDRDLCWRARSSGARVSVAPAARVRHREQLIARRPDLNHEQLRQRHRLRAAVVSAPIGSTISRVASLVLVTIAELVVGVFTGRFGDAAAANRALVGLIPRAGALHRRRRQVAPEPPPDGAVVFERGSARLGNFIRGRETATYLGLDSTVRRWRPTSSAPLLAWFLVVVGVIIGSRSFIDGGVPSVGEFLAFPASPGDLFELYLSGWDPRATGVTTAVPSGWLTLVIVNGLALFRPDLALTMSVIGLVLVGAAGAWRLAALFPTTRARIVAMVVYVATPLVPGSMATGRLSALVLFAVLPWAVHFIRRAAGIGTADPSLASIDLVDAVADLPQRERVRHLALATLVIALGATVAPVIVVVWVVVGAVLGGMSLLARARYDTAAWFAGGALLTAVGAGALSLPWSLGWSWPALVPTPGVGPDGRGLVATLALSVDDRTFVVLALALYVTAIGALAISTAWRLTWAIRASGLIVVFGALAVFADRGSLPFDPPDTAVLLVPVALGWALAAAAVAGGFGDDVVARGFGWRQPVGLLAAAAIVVGIIPAVVSIGNGSWNAPRTTIVSVLDAQLPDTAPAGAYRVLMVGDPRVLPVSSTGYRTGIGYAVVDADQLDATYRWYLPVTALDPVVVDVLDQISTGSTRRAGELLAPLGVRYVVVPEIPDAPVLPEGASAVPIGLLERLDGQLDLAATFGAPNVRVYANTAWRPTVAVTDAAGVTRPAFPGSSAIEPVVESISPGTVSIASALDERWRLVVDGTDLEPGPTAAGTMVFDVPSAGVAELGYRSPWWRTLWVVVVALGWVAVILAATRFTPSWSRRVDVAPISGPVIALDTPIDEPEPPLDPEADPWGDR